MRLLAVFPPKCAGPEQLCIRPQKIRESDFSLSAPPGAKFMDTQTDVIAAEKGQLLGWRPLGAMRPSAPVIILSVTTSRQDNNAIEPRPAVSSEAGLASRSKRESVAAWRVAAPARVLAGPDMFLATGFVVAKDAGWERFRCIGSLVHTRIRLFLVPSPEERGDHHSQNDRCNNGGAASPVEHVCKDTSVRSLERGLTANANKG
jgi:hypothetical protein